MQRLFFLILVLHALAGEVLSSPATLTQKHLESLWASLASADAARAFEAVLGLARLGDEAIPYLDKHLQPVPLPDQKLMAQLIKHLENDRYPVRSRAALELAKLGELAEPNLRQRLTKQPSLEVQRRIEQLLRQLQGTTDTPNAIQAMRALEVVEKIGSPGARGLLEKIARGFPGSRLTQEARDALERLDKRTATVRVRSTASTAKGPGLDRYGDALPAGAMLRLGTVRFRHPLAYSKIVFSPDGRSIAVSGQQDVRLLDVKTGKVQRRLQTNGNPILLAFSADGKLVTVSSLPGAVAATTVVQAWDLSGTNMPLTVSFQNDGQVGAQAISADGNALVAFADHGALIVWDLASGKEIHRQEVKGRSLYQLAISRDGSLVAGSDQNSILLWNRKTGAMKSLRTRPPYASGLVFSPDGKILANGSHSGEVRFWDTASGRLLRVVSTNGVPLYAAAFSPDGKLFASQHQEAGIWLWDPQSGTVTRKIDTAGLSLQSLAFSADSRFLAADFGAAMRLWDLRTRKPVTDFHEGHVLPVTLISFSPKDGVAATVGEDNAVRLWDIPGGRQLRVFQHTNWVRAIAFSPDGRHLASSCFDDTVRVFDPGSGREIYKLAGHSETGGLRALQFSRDGRELLSWGDDFYLRAWDMANGRAVREFRVGPAGMQLPDDDDDENQTNQARLQAARMFMNQDGAALSPDARDFVIAGEKGIDFVDNMTGKRHALKADGIGYASTLSFSPDGRWALVGRGQRFDILRLPSKTWSYSLPRDQKRWGNRPAISPDGRSIAITAGEHDERIELWEKLTAKKRVTLGGFDASVRSLAFSADGRYLAAGLSDATVLAWDVLDLGKGKEHKTTAK